MSGMVRSLGTPAGYDRRHGEGRCDGCHIERDSTIDRTSVPPLHDLQAPPGPALPAAGTGPRPPITRSPSPGAGRPRTVQMRPVPRQTVHVSPVAVLVPVPLQPGHPRVGGLLCLPTSTTSPATHPTGSAVPPSAPRGRPSASFSATSVTHFPGSGTSFGCVKNVSR